MKTQNKIILAIFSVILLFGVPVLASSFEAMLVKGVLGNIWNIDEKVNAGITITQEHHEIHEGNSFETHVYDTATTSLTVAFKVANSTDTSKEMHMVFGFGASAPVVFQIWENATWDNGTGISKQVNYQNRNKERTSETLLNDLSGSFIANNTLIVNPDNPDFTNAILIDDQITVVSKQAGGESRIGGHEWILCNGCTYVITMTNGANTLMEQNYHYYETTPKN